MMDQKSLTDNDFDKLSKADVRPKKNMRPTLKVKSINFGIK